MLLTRETLRAYASHRRARGLLGLVAFAESIIFPIPPDAMLAPMCLAAPARALRFATICTLLSVAGGLVGYLIGQFFYDIAAQPLIEFYQLAPEAEKWIQSYDRHGVLIVLIGALTPIPYKVVTLTSGAAGMNLAVFMTASLVARGLRFFAVALLCRFAGPHAEILLQKSRGAAGLFFAALAALAIIIIILAVIL